MIMYRVVALLLFLTIGIVDGLIANAGLPEPSTRKLAPTEAPLTPSEMAMIYFTNLTHLFEDRLRKFGLFNLPIHDYKQKLNRTIYGLKLLGESSFKFGFVTSMEEVRPEFRWFQCCSLGNVTYFKAAINFVNLTVFYDMRAKLEGHEPLIGTAKHTFPTNRIDVWVIRNSTEPPKLELRMNGVSSAKATDYVPDTPLTRALARVARLTTSIFLWDDIENWNQGVFRTILDNIVSGMPFPL